MRYVKWTILAVLALIVFGFLHYTLPQHDIVRVVNTYQERQDLTDWTRIFWSKPDDQSGTLTNRDVQFISTIKANGKTMVYRNEDTGWSWPFYFKFDTASLQAEADDLKSTKETPKWAVVTHYGWRNELISIFPNAVAIRPVAGPDVTVIPWFNIFFFLMVGFVLLMVRRMWLQFRERTIDPALEEAGAARGPGGGGAEVAGKRGQGWVLSWRETES